MKKIKILHWFIVVLIIVYIIYFSGNLYLTVYTTDSINFSKAFYNQFIFGYYTQFVDLGFSVITFIALFFLQNGLHLTIKKGFFNQNNSEKFKRAGQLFLVSGALSLVWSITLLIYSNGRTFFEGISSSTLLILIGFGLLILTGFIQNGNQLQQENDLTI